MTPASAGIVGKLTPEQIVGLTLYGEARGSSPALREAIASTILNRVKAHRPSWGRTAAAVCLKPWQFSCWMEEGGASNHRAVMEAAKLLASGALFEGRRSLMECWGLGRKVVAGTLPDTVAGATHYYSPAAMVPRDRVPKWAQGLEPVAVIDGTKFYAGVA